MARSIPVMTRVGPDTKAKLQALARSTRRSEAYLAKEAIEAFVEVNAWQVEEIKRGLEEAKSGTPGVSHERVEAWVRSWGTSKELKRPKPRT